MYPSIRSSLALVLVSILVACGTTTSPATTPAAAGGSTPPPAVAQPAATSAPAVAQPAAPPPGPLTPIRLGQAAAVAYPFYIGQERGYFEEQGIEIQYDQFRGGAEMVPLLASGQLDVSQQAVGPSVFNAVLRNVAVKAILDASQLAPGQRSHATLVRKELYDSGAVRTLADLVGRKLASPALSIDVDRGLRQYGHRLSDLDMVVLSFPDMPAALANGSVDAAMAGEPVITSALNQNAAVVLRWLSEDYPGHQLAVQMIGPSLVDRPELTRRLSVAYLRGARDWNDTVQHGIGVDELAALLARYNRLDAALNADLLRRRGFTSIDPDGRISRESLAYDMAWYVEGGHVERPIDLDQLVDNQYVEIAGAQLGPYTPRRP